MRKVFLFSLLAALLSGCAMMPTLPGDVSTSVSKFDGEQQVYVHPAWLQEGWDHTSLKVGGFWTDKEPDLFMLEIAYMGTSTIEGASVNIDGEMVELIKSSLPTDFQYIPGTYNRYSSIPGHSESIQRFVVPMPFIDRLMDAERVVFRVDLGGTRTEGVFSEDGSMKARPAFKKALAQIAKIQST